MAKKIDLDSNLLSILLTESFDNFTVLELRSAYLATVNSPELGKIEARKFVYRHILRLEKNKLLERKFSKKKDRTYYSKTKQFSSEKFQTAKSPQRQEVIQPDTTDSEDRIKMLVERLQNYNFELQSAIGESNEYKLLHAEFPQLKGLKECYERARNKMYDINGKIKAVETSIENNRG